MTVTRRSILGPSLASPAGTDGNSNNPQTDPWTGEQCAGYQAPRPSAYQSTAQQFAGTPTQRFAPTEAENRRATQLSSTISPLDSGAGGLALNFGGCDSACTDAGDYDSQALRRFGEVNPQDHGSGGLEIVGAQ
jgi:hypothetical protein